MSLKNLLAAKTSNPGFIIKRTACTSTTNSPF